MIPTWALLAVKDLIRRPMSDTGVDEELDAHYFDALKDILYKHDWLVESILLFAIADEHNYQLDTRTMRLLAVMYANIHLRKTNAISLDYLQAGWQVGAGNDASGTPEAYWINQLPDPNIVPNEFALHPAPNITDQILLTFQAVRPVDDDPITLWLRPLLIYSTAARYLSDAHAHRDAQVGEFYQAVADLWEHVLTERIQ